MARRAPKPTPHAPSAPSVESGTLSESADVAAAELGAAEYVRIEDPRELQVHRDPPARDVPYLPTDQHVVNKMMEMARVTRGDVLYDLGCGDGRICITAARLGARAVGVEIDLTRLRECHDNLRNTQLRDRVEFRRESFFDVDLRPASVVALYLLPAINRRLRPKLMYELRPGARIIANYFEIADWVPDEQIVFKHRPVMLWIVPAWVEGVWKCVLHAPAGGDSRHFHLSLARQFQFLGGVARWGRESAAVAGRVRGVEVQLTLPALPGHAGPVRIEARYDSGSERDTSASLRGRAILPDRTHVTFAAVRTGAGVRA
jgi:SAM-dependent methyltransferase